MYLDKSILIEPDDHYTQHHRPQSYEDIKKSGEFIYRASLRVGRDRVTRRRQPPAASHPIGHADGLKSSVNKPHPLPEKNPPPARCAGLNLACRNAS